jgi:hypothetical protein
MVVTPSKIGSYAVYYIFCFLTKKTKENKIQRPRAGLMRHVIETHRKQINRVNRKSAQNIG